MYLTIALTVCAFVGIVLVGREYLDRRRTRKLLRRLDKEDRQPPDIFRK